jgi:hypothetical protein
MPDNWIPTATGRRVFLDPIDVSEVRIRDIAVGLARQVRFNGQFNQTTAFYSVAEHCVWASYIAPIGKLAALVHDAAEAIIGDVTSPLKRMLPDYRAFERRFEDALRKHFNWPDFHTPAVKKADMQMLAIEREKLVVNRTLFECLDGVETPNVKLECWLPSMAAVVWEDRYKELTGRGF